MEEFDIMRMIEAALPSPRGLRGNVSNSGETTMEPTDSVQKTGGEAPKRKHRATYATDKRSGGYLVRVVGPTAERFAGREVPVTTKAGGEHWEKLARLVWAGTDKETGEPVALYKFESKPRDSEEAAF